MGLLYGAKLSKTQDVTLIGNNPDNISLINKNGVTVKREDKADTYTAETYKVKAVLNGTATDTADLVIMFTKAYLTEDALNANKNIIGPDTILLTLQNGTGHDRILRKFADESRILIGTTAQGSYRENPYTIVNSGLGDTVIGPVSGELVGGPVNVESGGGTATGIRKGISEIRQIFEESSFPCIISDDIAWTVWNKLMINASSSALSGVLGVRQGYVAEDANAWAICSELIREICMAAGLEGFEFVPEEQIDRIYKHLLNAPNGYTSIYSDLKNGRKTEVDYISGAVADTARRHGTKAPAHEMIVNLIHAMEGRDKA